MPEENNTPVFKIRKDRLSNPAVASLYLTSGPYEVVLRYFGDYHADFDAGKLSLDYADMECRRTEGFSWAMPGATPEDAFVKLEYLDMCFVDRIEKLVGEIREAAVYARAMKDIWLKYFPPEKCLPRAHRITESDTEALSIPVHP